ncbi:hypothetical protein GUJ93_ZPchr0002g25317 [Zizania palustris]|uniref:Uncharacterized protein n=1 Tax=Zizania palustris TaxID=103762 RepID=A0A8J5RQ71_ZIZPA|nr:hypothetical protein GUJ93_ZPchr0002g25317 [Zizania palustris]
MSLSSVRVPGIVTPIDTPTPSTSTASRSFKNWSAKCGHVTIGTPWAMASSIEFQPYVVRDEAADGAVREDGELRRPAAHHQATRRPLRADRQRSSARDDADARAALCKEAREVDQRYAVALRRDGDDDEVPRRRLRYGHGRHGGYDALDVAVAGWGLEVVRRVAELQRGVELIGLGAVTPEVLRGRWRCAISEARFNIMRWSSCIRYSARKFAMEMLMRNLSKDSQCDDHR